MTQYHIYRHFGKVIAYAEMSISYIEIGSYSRL